MDHVPMDDINEIWNQTDDKSWEGLENALNQHEDKAEGIDNALIGQMKEKINKLKEEGQEFPKSPDELYELLNEDSEDSEADQ